MRCSAGSLRVTISPLTIWEPVQQFDKTSFALFVHLRWSQMLNTQCLFLSQRQLNATQTGCQFVDIRALSLCVIASSDGN